MAEDNKSQDNDKSNISPNEQFVSLLMTYQKRIYGFILTLVPNRSYAEEIMQETVMVMCRKFNDFEKGSNFLAWGIGIARNKIIKFREKQRKACVLFSSETFDNIIKQSGTIVEDMDDRIKALEICLGKLDEKDRELIKKRYDQGLKIKNIADQIGRSVHGLYKSMARIHNILRQCVTRTLSAWEAA